MWYDYCCLIYLLIFAQHKFTFTYLFILYAVIILAKSNFSPLQMSMSVQYPMDSVITHVTTLMAPTTVPVMMGTYY